MCELDYANCDICTHRFANKFVTVIDDADVDEKTFVCVGCLNDFKDEELKLFMQNFESQMLDVF
jgi:hypothetical protein